MRGFQMCSSLVVALLVTACGQSASTEQTEAVLAHHLQAVGQGDLDAIMADYAADAVLYTPNGPLRGTEAIRGLFAGMPEMLPPDFWDVFQMVRQDVEGELAYIVWSGGDTMPLGTDTFVIRQGKTSGADLRRPRGSGRVTVISSRRSCPSTVPPAGRSGSR